MMFKPEVGLKAYKHDSKFVYAFMRLCPTYYEASQLVDLLVDIYFDARYVDDPEILSPDNRPPELESMTRYMKTGDFDIYWENQTVDDRRLYIYNFDKKVRAQAEAALSRYFAMVEE